MMNPRRMETAIRKTIARHLDMAQTAVFLFGSRAGGKAAAASDYDIGVYAGHPIPLRPMAGMRAELEESNLPVTVDVVDFSGVSENFKRIALRKVKVWSFPRHASNLKSFFLKKR